MRITRHSDYAFRILMFLALKADTAATVAEIAAHYDISRHHLTKVAQTLHQLGYLRATRGRGGGITLARDPQDINVGRVFRATEGELNVVECMHSDGACVLGGSCELKKLFGDASSAFLAVLGERTLADLLPPQKQRRMRNALAIEC